MRAQIGADGVVMLKPGRGGRARRMVVAAATAAGLLTAETPALARGERPAGAISGTLATDGLRIRVTATAPDGRRYRATSNGNAQFRIRHVPAGTYTLTYVYCGQDRVVENVVVRDGETVVPPDPRDTGCIVIGLLRIEDDRG